MSTRPRIVALVPACNEELLIQETIESLLNQTRPLDRILVIPNNCTDRTAEIARDFAARHDVVKVLEIHENTGRKAGALNLALATLNPDDWDFVLQMDADTLLDDRLVEEAMGEFVRNPRIGGVSSRCFLKPPEQQLSVKERLLWSLQNLEFGFGDSKHIQDGGHAKVLAGAVCVYRMNVLMEVSQLRRARKDRGIVWSESSLVEDYELTLDTQKLGHDTEIGMRMFSWTDAMFSVRSLWRQRFRWYGGTAATLRKRKFAPEIRTELFVQAFYMLVVLSRLLIVLLLGALVVTASITQINLEWWILGVVFVLILANYLMRLRYVRNKDLWQVAIVLTLIPLELYITWDQLLTLFSYGKNAVKPSTSW